MQNVSKQFDLKGQQPQAVPASEPAAAIGVTPNEGVSATDPDDPDRFIDDHECERLSGLSRTTRWRLEKRNKFPRRRLLSPGRVGWLLSEVLQWQRTR